MTRKTRNNTRTTALAALAIAAVMTLSSGALASPGKHDTVAKQTQVTKKAAAKKQATVKKQTAPGKQPAASVQSGATKSPRDNKPEAARGRDDNNNARDRGRDQRGDRDNGQKAGRGNDRDHDRGSDRGRGQEDHGRWNDRGDHGHKPDYDKGHRSDRRGDGHWDRKDRDHDTKVVVVVNEYRPAPPRRSDVLGTIHIGQHCVEVREDHVFDALLEIARCAGYRAAKVSVDGRTYIRIYGCPVVDFRGAGFELDVIRYHNDVIDIALFREVC